MKQLKIVINYKVLTTINFINVDSISKKKKKKLNIDLIDFKNRKFNKKKKKKRMINRFISPDAEPTYLEKGIQ